ncbi:hypothetical protein D3C81_1851820 [compost metagenome]
MQGFRQFVVLLVHFLVAPDIIDEKLDREIADRRDRPARRSLGAAVRGQRNLFPRLDDAIIRIRPGDDSAIDGECAARNLAKPGGGVQRGRAYADVFDLGPED